MNQEANDLVGQAAPKDTSATQRAYRELRHMVLTGVLSPGEKLKIERLRSLLDMGASPIREALSLLTSDQLVERIDQRGFRAAETSRENFVEILTLRCQLEEMALRLSIEKGLESWEEQIVLAHHRMLRVPRDDVQTFEERHKDFHMSLLSACDSPILLKFCNQLYDLNIRYRYIAGRSNKYQTRDVATEHAAILNAAVERDADRACAELINHYRQTGAFLDGILIEAEGVSA